MKFENLWSLFLVCLLVGLLPGCGSGDDDDDTTDDDDTSDDDDSAATMTFDDTGIKEAGVADPPPMDVVPERPTSGEEVVVTVNLADATSVDLIASGPGCGGIGDASGPAPLSLAGPAASDGYCHLSATLTLSDGSVTVLEGRFEIRSTDPALPPIDVPGAILVMDEMSLPSGEAGEPVIDAINGSTAFINGGTINYTVDFTGEAPAALLVRVEGFLGYYLLPVDPAVDPAEFTLQFPQDIFDLLSENREEVAVVVAMLDRLDRISAAVSLVLNGTLVGTGEVQVGITWDTPTDVDLHVTEPDGEEIYFGNLSSTAGGTLDLDSNPACNIDGVNAENIFWPLDQSPVGEFTARVNMYDSCEVGATSGTITITYCGKDSPIVEPFSLGATGTDQTWTFDSSCAYQVAGRVRYEDFTVKRTGLATSGTLVPSRFVTVQVVRLSDDSVLNEGYTDRAGKYRITFQNDQADENPDYYVRVVAHRDSDTLKQQVKALDGNLYGWESLDIFSTDDDPIKEDVDFSINREDDGGALNLFEVGVESFAFARAWGGSTPPLLTWRWTEGQKPNGNNVSYYNSGSKTIWVLGDAADTDEYDDPVLGHEFGHFALDVYSDDNSPGGQHFVNMQSDPRLAWSEGWATFFGQGALKLSTYIDTNTGGVGVLYSVETRPTGVTDAAGNAITYPLGNAGNTLNGNVAESVVTFALWDLHDTTNESKDTLGKKDLAIWGSVRKYLNSPNANFADRGVAGRDLVDFLDGWRCLGYGNDGADNTEGLKGNAIGLHQLSYDFPALPACN